MGIFRLMYILNTGVLFLFFTSVATILYDTTAVHHLDTFCFERKNNNLVFLL